MKTAIQILQNLGAEIKEQKSNGSTYLFADKIGTIRVSNHSISMRGLTMENRFGIEIIKYPHDDNYRLYLGGRTGEIFDNIKDSYIDSIIENNEDVTEEELRKILVHIFITTGNETKNKITTTGEAFIDRDGMHVICHGCGHDNHIYSPDAAVPAPTYMTCAKCNSLIEGIRNTTMRRHVKDNDSETI